MATTPYPLLRLFADCRPYPGLIALTLFLAVAAHSTVPLTQHLVGMAFGDLIAGDAVRPLPDGGLDTSGAWLWAGILLAVALLRGSIAWLATVAAFASSHRLLHHLRQRLFYQVQRLDLGWHRRHGAGGLITRTTRDGDKIRDALIHGSRMVLETSLFLLGVLAFMVYYHWSLALITATAIAVATWIMWAQAPILVRLDRHAGDRYDRLTQDLGEGVAGVRVVKAFRLEALRIAAFTRLVNGFSEATQRAQRSSEWRLNGPQIIVALNHAGAAFLGAGLVTTGHIGIGDLTAILMMLLAVVFRIEALARGFALFYEARASAARVQEVLQAQPSLYSGAQDLPPGPLGMTLHGVTLHGDGRPILEDISLTIAAGETVAVVGATGSGKSSLLGLLPRLWDPDRGTVAVCADDGSTIPLTECRLPNLRSTVHLVPQEAFLLSMSVADNLRLAAPHASPEAINQALADAAAEDIISGLADGLDSLIGERGTTLSGGQKQRLCLARALLAKPRILILDDATSALDSATEARVFDALQGQGATVIMGAARVSTVLRADRVLWLEAGRVRAYGRHEALVATYPDYVDLLGLGEEAAA